MITFNIFGSFLIFSLLLEANLFASEKEQFNQTKNVEISDESIEKAKEKYTNLLECEKKNEESIKHIFQMKGGIFNDYEVNFKEIQGQINEIIDLTLGGSFVCGFTEAEKKELRQISKDEDFGNKDLMKKFWKYVFNEKFWTEKIITEVSNINKKKEEITQSILEFSSMTRCLLLKELGLNGVDSSFLIIDSFTSEYQKNIISNLRFREKVESSDDHGKEVDFFVQSVAKGSTPIPIFYDVKDDFDKKTKLFGDLPEPFKEYKIFDQIKQSLKNLNSISTPHVINVSIDGDQFFCFFNNVFQELTDLLNFYDILLVKTPGNDGEFLTESENSEDIWGNLFKKYPKLKERMLFVGAIDPIGGISTFSGLPGELSDIMLFAPGQELPIGDKKVEGTSFAVPQVSGLFVLLKKYFPNLNMLELKEIVLSTTNPFPDYIEGFDKKEIVGCGKLDAFKAFLEAHKRSEEKKK